MHDLLILAVGAILGGGGILLQSYFSEKGRNIATKEDIATITREVEGVKAESLAQLERLKVELSQAQLLNRTQFELELSAYREVWESLLAVHRAAAGLRPVWDRGMGQGETEESRRSERLKAFADTFNPFSQAVWKHRPFYPEAVYKELDELLRLTQREAIEYQHMRPENRDYWDQAMSNAKAINTQVERICETIRSRLSVARVA